MNQVINLKHFLPGSLLDAMKQPIGFEERIKLIQNFLLNAYQKKTGKDHYLMMVSDAIGEFHATGMQLNTSAVAERLFVTSKTINRYFHRVVGISPKSYFCIFRARTALSAFIGNQEPFVPTNFGYYDMSHFYKDVIRFTGQKLGNHTF